MFTRRGWACRSVSTRGRVVGEREGERGQFATWRDVGQGRRKGTGPGFRTVLIWMRIHTLLLCI